jgi:uncharacterized membrane protein
MAQTWHHAHADSRSVGERFADSVARVLGSWPFIIAQTVFVIIWMMLNVVGWVRHWDAYPFILLNLLFSVQAAYAAPVIMMSQNRQADRDRFQAQADYTTNVKSETEIEQLMIAIAGLDAKVDRLLQP